MVKRCENFIVDLTSGTTMMGKASGRHTGPDLTIDISSDCSDSMCERYLSCEENRK